MEFSYENLIALALIVGWLVDLLCIYHDPSSVVDGRHDIIVQRVVVWRMTVHNYVMVVVLLLFWLYHHFWWLEGVVSSPQLPYKSLVVAIVNRVGVVFPIQIRFKTADNNTWRLILKGINLEVQFCEKTYSDLLMYFVM